MKKPVNEDNLFVVVQSFCIRKRLLEQLAELNADIKRHDDFLASFDISGGLQKEMDSWNK